MSGAERRIVNRPRRPGFSDTALSLFIELDGAPPSFRESREFRDQSLRLAEMLDLNVEWWQCQDVLDRSERPHHPPNVPANRAWHKARAVRLALIEAAAAYTIEKGRHNVSTLGKESAKGVNNIDTL
jgi:hypothetical protein